MNRRRGQSLVVLYLMYLDVDVYVLTAAVGYMQLRFIGVLQILFRNSFILNVSRTIIMLLLECTAVATVHVMYLQSIQNLAVLSLASGLEVNMHCVSKERH